MAKVWLLVADMFNCLQQILQVLLLPCHCDKVGCALDATLGIVIDLAALSMSPFLHIERYKFWINVQLVHPKAAVLIGEVSQAGDWHEGGELWLAKASAKALFRDVHVEISELVLQVALASACLTSLGTLLLKRARGSISPVRYQWCLSSTLIADASMPSSTALYACRWW